MDGEVQTDRLHVLRCAVCGQTSDRVVWRENGYEGRACSCGTVYTTPEPAPGEVDPTIDAHPDSFYGLPAALKVRWLWRCQPGGSLLEIGCGEGYFLNAARAAGYEVAGVEPHPERARRVMNGLGIQVECSLLEDLDWPEASFDVVYHCDLLSHFPDPIGALQKMAALLRPGGVLAFEVGALGDIAKFWYRWVGSLGYPYHRWLYSEQSLEKLLGRAGLRIERIKHFGLAPSVVLDRFVHFGWLAVRPLVKRRQDAQLMGPLADTRVEAPESVRRLYDHIAMLFRYRLGALSPRLGPGTFFIAARKV